MQALRGLAWLLLAQSAGELVSRGAQLPFPGPVVGMLLMLAALQIPSVREPVAACAEFLLQHLSLLFVPVGVGVLAHLDLVARHGGRLLVVLVLSTWIGLATVVLAMRLLARPPSARGDAVIPGVPVVPDAAAESPHADRG